MTLTRKQELERASGGMVKQTKYLKQNPLRQHLIGRYLRNIREFAEIAGAARVLDVGCGEGFVVRHLLDHLPHLEIAGVDLDPQVLRVARYQAPRSLFARASAYELPFAAARYDLVLCNEVLEHLDEPQRAIREIKRVGARYFAFSVPREPHFRLANMAIGANWSRWGDDEDHCQRWTLAEFAGALAEHFEVLQVRPTFPWTMVLCKHG